MVLLSVDSLIVCGGRQSCRMHVLVLRCYCLVGRMLTVWECETTTTLLWARYDGGICALWCGAAVPPDNSALSESSCNMLTHTTPVNSSS